MARWNFATALEEILIELRATRRDIFHWKEKTMSALDDLTKATNRLATSVDAKVTEDAAAMTEIRTLLTQVAGSTDPAIAALAAQINTKLDAMDASTAALKAMTDAFVPPPGSAPPA